MKNDKTRDDSLILELQAALDAAAQGLAKTTGRKMFGCHALWADGAVYALVWKHGRIGVKLPDSDAFGELMSVKGAEPWKAGSMSMSHWVLVPPAFHTKKTALAPWVKKAHALALEAGPPGKAGVSAKKKRR